MARVVFPVFCLVVCVMSVVSSPTEQEIPNEKVGYQETGWKALEKGNSGMGRDPQSIREKGRMLFASFRQKARTLLTMKRAEWKEADLSPEEMEANEKIAETYQYVSREAEYEIKERILNAMNGEEPVADPDVPRHSEEIATLFMQALFASTYAEQTSNEDSMMQILKNVLENKAH